MVQQKRFIWRMALSDIKEGAWGLCLESKDAALLLCLCNISHFNNQPVEALKEDADRVHANKVIWTKLFQHESVFGLFLKLFLMLVLLLNVDLFGCSLKSNPASSRCTVLLYLDSKNGTKRLKSITCVTLFWREMPTFMIWKVFCVKLHLLISVLPGSLWN